MQANGDFHTSYLYNPDLLYGLDWKSVQSKVTPFITNEEPGEDYFLVRPLHIEDYDKGFLQLLSQLTTVGDVSKSDFEGNYCISLVTKSTIVFQKLDYSVCVD